MVSAGRSPERRVPPTPVGGATVTAGAPSKTTTPDESGSMATVRVPVGLPGGWIDDHRRRLRQVRDHWVPKLLE
ncbi:DUF5959 family protein [Streptomyces bauhiniae]|uniref:DUF5959 family protein n=1 Tax=Streptomyces bauhiniae TaxID=2340725 RepID=UPI003662833C